MLNFLHVIAWFFNIKNLFSFLLFFIPWWFFLALNFYSFILCSSKNHSLHHNEKGFFIFQEQPEWCANKIKLSKSSTSYLVYIHFSHSSDIETFKRDTPNRIKNWEKERKFSTLSIFSWLFLSKARGNVCW